MAGEVPKNEGGGQEYVALMGQAQSFLFNAWERLYHARRAGMPVEQADRVEALARRVDVLQEAILHEIEWVAAQDANATERLPSTLRPSRTVPDLRFGFRDPYNDRPADLKPGDRFYYTVVGRVGYAQDWAAYVGFGEPEAIWMAGHKLGEKAARALFPICDHLEYRP